jgi:hypothetical protein
MENPTEGMRDFVYELGLSKAGRKARGDYQKTPAGAKCVKGQRYLHPTKGWRMVGK